VSTNLSSYGFEVETVRSQSCLSPQRDEFEIGFSSLLYEYLLVVLETAARVPRASYTAPHDAHHVGRRCQMNTSSPPRQKFENLSRVTSASVEKRRLSGEVPRIKIHSIG